MKVFLDTNVWIDLVAERQPFCVDAVSALSRVVDNNWQLCLTSQTLVTAHYICHDRQKMPVGEIWAKLDCLQDVLEICPVTREEIFSAYKSGWKDFEDAVQYACALHCGADVIITRNPKDFVSTQMQVCTPQEFMQLV